MSDDTCYKRKDVLVDCHVEADLSGYLTWWDFRQGQEHIAKELERYAKELEEFVRDHRSRDPLSLSVIRHTQDLCSNCEREWETAIEDEKEICANCGATVSMEPMAKVV